MKKMIIFEKAMCCSTGVCGPGVDKELLRISTVINNLKNNGIIVERYNLSNNTQIFVDNKEINKIINEKGVEELPVTIVDKEVVKTKEYPTNDEFCKFLDIAENLLKSSEDKQENKCNCKGGCC